LKDWLYAVLDLARQSVRREAFTPAGRINLVGILIALGGTFLLGAADLVQIVVRIFRPEYSSGLPSSLWLLGLAFLTLLGCVAILAAAEKRDQ